MVYIMGEQQLILTNKLLEEMKLQDYQKDNTIYIDEDITSESVELWSRQLKNLGNKQLSKSKEDKCPIKLIINCNGGSARDTFYFIDLMEYYKKRGVEIYTYVTACAYSGAFKIGISGSKRFGYKHSEFLCHQWNRFEYGTKTYQDIVNEREHNDKLYNELAEIITSKTKITREMLDSYTKQNRDFIMDSKTALYLSVIDEIIE